jgi:diguanylate cyclase (GGDEF)-like protein/PAS domain S-box-containing protein
VKTRRSPPLAHASDDVAALIATLHQTEQRLEELTGGEVDTVADRDGRTFLLRHAQEQLRASEAAKQAAVLDVLAQSEAGLHRAQLMAKLAHVITGADGSFERWSDTLPPLVGMQPAHLPRSTRAWLEILHPEDRSLFREKSIEAAVSKSRVELEYRLRNGDGRWIRIRQAMEPLKNESDATGGSRWFNTLQDVTAQRQTEESLRESERRFSDMLGNIELVSLMLDTNARITYCNDYLLRLTGWRREEVMGGDWFELFIPPKVDDLRQVNAALLADKPEALHHENEILTRSGERRLIRWNNSVLRSGGGDVIGTASIGEDITEQKRAEVRIRRLNRVYAVLSGINTLIVRVRDREELFTEACRIAVDHGHFQMAWIGVVDRSAMQVVPVASAGAEPEFLTLIKDHFSLREDAPLGNTLTARAVREKKAMVSNDIIVDPRIFFAKQRLERGIASLAVLPLLIADDAVGVLALYAGDAGFFDEEEMKLLTELAGDIGFALDHIDKEKKLEYLAYYEALTGLANRSLFLERVAQSMRSAASAGHKLALFLIDLERFKNINDSLGRPAGDALLRQVAEWLRRNTGDANLLARVGADHFAVVLPEVSKDGDVARLLENTLEVFLEHPFRLNDAVFRIAAKVGVAVFPDDGVDADALFRNAESALKKAKASGDRYLFYTQRMSETVAGELTLENQLRQALDQEEFVLHYQPKVNLASGKLVGVEALIRWNDPRTGLVPPGRFIPILEATGLIYDVGRWALRKAMQDYLRWLAAGLPAVRIAVNMSPLQLRNRGFIAEVQQVIGVHAHAAGGLELEITESLIMEDVKRSITSLQAIRAMGVTIAIDDFGTGFSSLSYLSKLPVDTLKIDGSFVTEMTAGPQGLALVSTIISLAHSLRLNVVAEGVETEEQSRLLRVLNCDQMQGFLFSKPLPGELFEARYLAPPAAA